MKKGNCSEFRRKKTEIYLSLLLVETMLRRHLIEHPGIITNQSATLYYFNLISRARCSTETMLLSLNLSYDGGGALCAPQSVFIFLLRISPPDQTKIIQ